MVSLLCLSGRSGVEEKNDQRQICVSYVVIGITRWMGMGRLIDGEGLN